MYETLLLRFAFNCGSTESVESRCCVFWVYKGHLLSSRHDLAPLAKSSQQDPYYNIPAIIAINMIMAAASGGIIAILIATWAQVSGRKIPLDDNYCNYMFLSCFLCQCTHTHAIHMFLFFFKARLRASSINANEVANGVLSALVSITAGCAFVDYWGACLIGGKKFSYFQSCVEDIPLGSVIAVVVYHFGCWLEYRLRIEDTARVFPVHALW